MEFDSFEGNTGMPEYQFFGRTRPAKNLTMETNKKNSVRYLVCSSPRVGSHLLFSLLENAGLSAKGHIEKMHPEVLRESKIDWEKKDVGEFIGELFNSGKTPAEVSGFKICWAHVENFVRVLNNTERYKEISAFDIMSYFPSEVKYIYLRRRNKVRQGISRVKAMWNGIWRIREGNRQEPVTTLHFDYESIADCITWLKRQEKGWERFFKTNGISPLRIEYEELIRDYRGTVVRIFEYLGIPLPVRLELKTDMIKQSDALSEEWLRRYCRMRLWLGPWLGPLRFLYRVSAQIRKYCPLYGQFIKMLKSKYSVIFPIKQLSSSVKDVFRRLLVKWKHDKDKRIECLYREKPYLDAYSMHTDIRVSDDPHEAVGGMWEKIGKLQLDFLVNNGLQPHHKLLDIGCGTLRGGVYFIRYLNAGNYSGIDISPKAVEYGKRLVEQEGLSRKQPRLEVNKTKTARFKEFDDEVFDYLLAHSVFTHLKPEHIEECFHHIGRIMNQDSLFFFTFKEALEFKQIGLKNFGYPLSFFQLLADECLFDLKDRTEDYEHPRGQHMAVLSKKRNFS